MANKYKRFSKAYETGGKIKHYIRSCLGKRKYKTKAKANKNIPKAQTAYSCRYCKGFHRGSVEPSIYKMIKDKKGIK